MATNPLTSNDATPVPAVAVLSTELLITGMNKADVQALTNPYRKVLVERLAEALVRQTDAKIWQAFCEYTQNPALTLHEVGDSGTQVVASGCTTYYWLSVPVVCVYAPEHREAGGRLEVTQCVERLFESPAGRDWTTQSLPLT